MIALRLLALKYQGYENICTTTSNSKMFNFAAIPTFEISCEHPESFNLHARHQGVGYRLYHSCESAAIKIYNYILQMDGTKNKVVLLLLDRIAAFDTVNHQHLLSKFKVKYGNKLESFSLSVN